VQRAFAVQRLATTIYHPAQQIRAYRHTACRGQWHYTGTRLQALYGGKWHQIDFVIFKANNFGLNTSGSLALNNTAITYHHGTANTFKGEANHSGQASG
jgi:hypothetical protein